MRLLLVGIISVAIIGCAPTALPTSTPTRAPETATTVQAVPTAVPAKPTPTLTPASSTPSPTFTATPMPTSKPSATPQPTTSPTKPEATPASPRPQATVIRVVDGDTIDVNIGGKAYTVRYIGVDTPETVDPRRPVQCFGQEASAKNKELVAGKAIQLEKDVSETDKYSRLLRYVYAGETMINAELVRLGYARASTYPPDVKHQELFRRLEAEARSAERGLWSAGVCLTPTPAAPPTGPAPKGSVRPLAGGACPPEAPIKGNRNSMIFHVPGGQFYEATKAEECFATEQAAQTAGYRRSQR